ncbi:ArsR/SmtB family transcription factor [Paenibacillus sp. HJGM_3]|uniref:ArsR/SmtB family transcription factor n=1 Tax=Paenibacillus sp. HJGM_3 TaxID=3379816 RepID=UPI003858190B
MDTSTINALSEPNRLRIVELLIDGALPVGEISERLQLRQPQVSKHLRVLLNAGLVEVHADANRRLYQLRMEPFQALDEWLSTYRGVMDSSMDHLEHYMQKLNFSNPQSKPIDSKEE